MIRSLRWVMLALGIAVCVCFTFARVPGLYNGLWEDEIHYYAPILLSPTVHSFRADIGPIMKPFLDFALRRWIWFSRLGFSVFEQRLALVSLLYSFFHLLAWMILPWTPYLGVRLIAVLLLGMCSVESQYSAEAQGYSFYSFAPTLMFFAFLWCCDLLKRKRVVSAAAIFLVAMMGYLNSHFFSWPSCLIVLTLFMAYIGFDETLDLTQKNKLLQILLVGTLGVGLVTVIADKPGLYFLLFRTPAPRADAHIDWKASMQYVSQSWSWLGLPVSFFLFAALFGLIHPQRAKRYVAWGAFLTLFVAKFFLVAAMTAKSSYGVADRYMIMFISPSILAFTLGFESLAEWSRRWIRGSGASIVIGVLAIMLIQRWPSLCALPNKSIEGLTMAHQMPPNYSSNFFFFERVKAYKRPLLILTNHCWASDIPSFYMSKTGEQVTMPYTIANTNGICETPPTVLLNEIRQFASAYKNTGNVVFFYEGDQESLVPCRVSSNALYRRPDGACVGIVPGEISESLLAKANL
jgi:hypothetical protein